MDLDEAKNNIKHIYAVTIDRFNSNQDPPAMGDFTYFFTFVK